MSDAAYYAILQRTPFPGYLQPLPEWQLQHAEFMLGMNVRFYHERARRIGGLLTYTLADAHRITAYWRTRMPYADFALLAYHGSTHEQLD